MTTKHVNSHEVLVEALEAAEVTLRVLGHEVRLKAGLSMCGGKMKEAADKARAALQAAKGDAS